MKPLLITSKASFLSVRHHQLLYTDYINRKQADYPARQLPFDSIIIYRAGGNVSFEAVRLLMKQSVPIVYLSWDGTQIGTLLPPKPISGELRLAQYQTFLTKSKRELLARAFVEEKVSKSFGLMKFLKLRYPAIDLTGMRSVPRTPSLGLFEGKVAEAYWTEFGTVIRSTQTRFDFRSRKSSSNNVGASDPINSLLNYCYGILQAKVRLAIQKVGLDPEVGFLHLPVPNATPLVYDVMELFRWLVDLTVIELVESRSVKLEDFGYDQDYKVSVKERAAHLVVERFSQNFNRTVRVGGQNLKYESILDLDTRKLARFIQGRCRTIDFSYPLVADDSKVDSYLADRVTEMTPEERRMLGIPKTTLFYMRKNLAIGKPVRVYRKVRERLVRTRQRQD